MIKKLTLISSIFALTLSATANAKPLKIDNLTKDVFSVKVNNQCIGKLVPNFTLELGNELLSDVCKKAASNCKAVILKSDNCSGMRIATLRFSVKSGLTSTMLFGDNYALNTSFPFNRVSVSQAI